MHSHVAFAARPGEHACCRFASAEDRRLLIIALVCDAVRRHNKIVYLCPDGVEDAIASLARLDDIVMEMLESGQMEVRPAHPEHVLDRMFDAERMLTRLRGEHERACSEGYAGLSITGDMSWALANPEGRESLDEYEQAVSSIFPDAKPVVVCLYDHSQGRPGTISHLCAVHDVDFSPELASLARQDQFSAARVLTEGTLRLVGELDFGCAPALANVLATHFHGQLRLDLGDLTYVDVTGMRALRGRKGQPLRITAASDQVRRLTELLAWDTDPGVEVPA